MEDGVRYFPQTLLVFRKQPLSDEQPRLLQYCCISMEFTLKWEKEDGSLFFSFSPLLWWLMANVANNAGQLACVETSVGISMSELHTI